MQRLHASLRLLGPRGISLRIKISRLERIVSCAISAPLGKYLRIVSFSEDEVCLGTANVPEIS